MDMWNTITNSCRAKNGVYETVLAFPNYCVRRCGWKTSKYISTWRMSDPACQRALQPHFNRNVTPGWTSTAN